MERREGAKGLARPLWAALAIGPPARLARARARLRSGLRPRALHPATPLSGAAPGHTVRTPHDSALGGPDGIGISSVGIKSMPSAVAPAERFSARAAAGAKTTVEIAKAKGRQRRR